MIACRLTWEVLRYRVKPSKPHLKLWIGTYPPCGDA